MVCIRGTLCLLCFSAWGFAELFVDSLRRILRQPALVMARQCTSKLKPDMAGSWLPLLVGALGTVNLRLNLRKTKVWIPSAAADRPHRALLAAGLPQVFGSLELMGGALEGRHAASIGCSTTPAASTKRLGQAEVLAQTLQEMLRTTLARPVHRAVWTLLDKVLNKALDYDARILHPESFSTLAERLDRAVLTTSCKAVRVDRLTVAQESCLRLSRQRLGQLRLGQLRLERFIFAPRWGCPVLAGSGAEAPGSRL